MKRGRAAAAACRRLVRAIVGRDLRATGAGSGRARFRGSPRTIGLARRGRPDPPGAADRHQPLRAICAARGATRGRGRPFGARLDHRALGRVCQRRGGDARPAPRPLQLRPGPHPPDRGHRRHARAHHRRDPAARCGCAAGGCRRLLLRRPRLPARQQRVQADGVRPDDCAGGRQHWSIRHPEQGIGATLRPSVAEGSHADAHLRQLS